MSRATSAGSSSKLRHKYLCSARAATICGSTAKSTVVIARRQIAEVLVRSLTSEAATRKTFELVADRGVADEANGTGCSEWGSFGKP